MNTLEQLNLSQPLTDVYTAMETDIMMAIARQLARDGEISSTSEWRMKKLAESGALSRETAQIIASYTGIQSDLLTLTIEQAAVKVTNKLEPALQAVAKDGFIDLKDSTPISAGMKNVVSNFRRQARSDLNLVNTVMQYKAGSSYTYLVNKVYSETVENRQELLAALGKHTLEVASGAETRQTAIRNCIKEFAQKGIPAFVDRAGREWSPEAYISMDIRTTVGNTANATQDACCDRYGIDLFAVSSHMGARPKCAPYQGKVISRSNRSGIAHDGDGNEIPYIPLSSTSYGEPDGLFGIYCGHNKYPFIDGVSFQRYYPYEKEANAKRCNEFKQQRALEREVRIASREVYMMKEQNDPEGLKASREKLKQLRQEYSKYSADHGLKEHNDRASVVRIRKGDDVFGKIYTNQFESEKKSLRESPTRVDLKYIHSKEYRDKFDKVTNDSELNDLICQKARDILEHRNGTLKEDMYLIDRESKKVVGTQTHSTDEQHVKYNKSLESAIKNHKPYSLISIHNHPESTPPSGSDIYSNPYHKYDLGIVACHDGTVYTYKVRKDNFSAKLFDLTVDKYKKLKYNETEAYELALNQFAEDYGLIWKRI